jgi:hypothetical protein
MTTTTETKKNLDKEVIEYFEQTGQLFPEVFGLDSNLIRELIDAIPEKCSNLIEALKEAKSLGE